MLMISDIHFEPFWDPGKVARLSAAPVPEWHAILAAPSSPDRAQQFAALEQKCKTRGEDTSFPLLSSSLKAMKADAADARFLTLSGDLISHSFTCKFNAVVPNAKPGDYQSFVEKTIGFVESELHTAFPRVPVFAALGNNDSSCEDYDLDAQSTFLANVGSLLTADVPKAEQATAVSDFTAEGDYNTPLPAPLHGTRILVVDDLFQSAKYKTCGGKPDQTAIDAQVQWLKKQLDSARADNEKVWVMGHIPPGIDPYSTIRSFRNICAGESATVFLSSDALGSTLASYGDVIKLAIFGHTHMDELRLLEPEKASPDAGTSLPVPIKIVPSISPVDGNNPSFVVAQVDAATSILKDYRVFAASNQTGVAATWTEEYDFDKAYHQPDFSAQSLTDLVGGFKADPHAQSEASDAYLKAYFVRDVSLALKAFWPQYVCALGNRTTETYRSCLCANNNQ